MKFGDNLRNLRKSKNMSQEKLAEKIGVSRQSVSKWETGEAYPEMTNILVLCEIFHCKINELVNDSLIDVDSLDEEIKMSVVKFKEEKQRKVKKISKAIYVLARIAKSMVGIVACISILLMIGVPVFWNKVEISNDKMEIFGETYDYKIEDRQIIIGDAIIDVDNTDNVKEYLVDHSKIYHILTTEYVFISLAFSFIVMYFIAKYIEKLFINIYNEDTPFILDNVHYIKKIAILTILAMFSPDVLGIIFCLITKLNLNIEVNLLNIVFALMIFCMAYIFEYGYEIQLDSKGRMYGNEE